MTHPLGEGYLMWCELNACPECFGDGQIETDTGLERTCDVCDGTGVDPNAEYNSPSSSSRITGDTYRPGNGK